MGVDKIPSLVNVIVSNTDKVLEVIYVMISVG
jgi:hypothetical protein